MSRGGGEEEDEMGEEEEEDEELRELREEFEKQESLLVQLKGALKSNDAKLEVKEKQIKDMSARLFSKSKLKDRAREAAAKATERQLTAETSGVAVPISKPPGKMSKLKSQLREARVNEARLAEGQKTLEEKVTELERELAERDKVIHDYDLASVTTSPMSGSPFVMSPAGGSPTGSPPLGSSFEDVFSDKDNTILDLNEKIHLLQNQVLDLQEDLRNKDQVIRARTEAVSAVSKDLSEKGRSILDELEETRCEMKNMQEKFTESEVEWTKTNLNLKVDNETLAQNLSRAQEANVKLEKTHSNLSQKNASLLEKNLKLQSELEERRSIEREEVSALERQLNGTLKELVESKERLRAYDANKENHLEKFGQKIREIFEDNQDIDSKLGDSLAELQEKIVELEEEKGNLQLKLVDYEDESGLKLQLEVQRLKENLRFKDDEIERISIMNEDILQESNDRQELILSKDTELSDLSIKIEDLIKANQDLARSKVALEIRALELEETKEKLEADNAELSQTINQLNIETKEPLKELRKEFSSVQEKLQNLERTHAECKSRQLQSDRDSLNKSKKIEEHQIEISQLQKVLECKTLEISEELTRSDILEKELTRLNEKIEEMSVILASKEEEIIRLASNDVQEQIVSMGLQLTSLHTEIEVKKEELMKVDTERELLNNELDVCQNKVIQLGNEVNELTNENALLKEEKGSLINEREKLNCNNLALLENNNKIVSEIEIELVEARVKIEELAKEKESLNSGRVKAEEEIESYKIEIDKWQKEVHSIKNDLDEKIVENETLKVQLNEVNSNLQEYLVKNTGLSNEIKKKANELSYLKKDISAKQDVIVKIQEENSAHLERISHLEEILNKANDNKACNDNLSETIADYEKLKVAMEERHESLKMEIFNLETENSTLKKELIDSQEDIKFIKIQKEDLSLKLVDYEARISESQCDIDKAKSALMSKEERIDILLLEISDLKSKDVSSEKDDVINNLQESIKCMQDYMNSVKAEMASKIEEIESLKVSKRENAESDIRESLDLQAKISELESYIQIKNIDIERECSIRESMKLEILKLKEDLEEKTLILDAQKSSEDTNYLKERIVMLNANNDHLQYQKNVLDEKLSSLVEDLNKSKSINISDESELKELKTENDKLKANIDLLNVKIKSVEANYSNALKGHNESDIIKERDRLKVKNDQLIEKAKKLLAKCKHQEKALKEKDEELKSLTGTLEKKNEEANEKWQSETSEKSELIEKYKSLNEDCFKIRKELKEGVAAAESLRSENESLKSTISDSKNKYSELTESVNFNKKEMEISLKTLEQENIKILSQIKEFEISSAELKAQNSELNGTIDYLNKIRADFEKEIEELRAKKVEQLPSKEEAPIFEENSASGWDDDIPIITASEPSFSKEKLDLVSSGFDLKDSEKLLKSKGSAPAFKSDDVVDFDDGWGEESWSAWEGASSDQQGDNIIDVKEQKKTFSADENYEAQIKNLKSELKKLVEKLEIERIKFSEEEDALFERISQLEAEVNDKVKGINTIEDLNSALQLKTAEISNLNKEIKDMSNTTAKLEAENLNFINKTKCFISDIDSLKKDSESKSEHVDSLERDLNFKSDIVDSLKKDLKSKSDSIDSLVKDLESISKNVDSLKEELKSKSEELFKSCDEKEILSTELKKHETCLNQFEALKTELNLKHSQLEYANALANERSFSIERLTADISYLQEERQSTLKTAESVNEELKNKTIMEEKLKEELQIKNLDYERLLSNDKQEKDNTANIESELGKLRFELSKLKALEVEAESLKNEISFRSKDQDHLNKAIKSLEEELSAKSLTEDSVKLKLADLEEKFNSQTTENFAEISRLKNENIFLIQELDNTKENYRETLESLNSEIVIKTGNQDPKAEIVDELTKRLQETTESSQALILENASLKTQISNLEQDLNQKSIEINTLALRLDVVINQRVPVNNTPPPPDVTQYQIQQQPDVALHSVPQPDIMPPSYVDLVQQPSELVDNAINWFNQEFPEDQEQSWTEEPPSVLTAESQTDSSDNQIDVMSRMISDLEKQVAVLREETNTLRVQRDQNLEKLRDQQIESDTRFSQMKEELHNKETEINFLKNEKSCSEPQNSNIETSAISSYFGEQNSQMEYLESPSNNETFNLEWFQQEITNYRTIISNWEKWGQVKVEEAESYGKAYEEVSQKLGQTQANLESLTSEAETLRGSFEKLSLDNEELRAEKERMKETKGKNEDSWRSKYRAKEIEIQDLTETAERLISEKEVLSEEVSQLRKMNESLRTDRENLMENEEIKSQLDELSDEKRSLGLQLKSTSEKAEKITKERDECLKTIKKLDEEVLSYKSMVSTLESEIEAVEKVIGKREKAAEERVTSTQSEIDSLKLEFQLMQSENELAKINKEKAEDEIVASKKEIISIREQLNTLLSEHESLKSEKEELNKVSETRAISLQTEIDKLKSQNVAIKTSKESTEGIEVSSLSGDEDVSLLKEELTMLKTNLETSNAALSEWSVWGQSKIAEYDTLMVAYNEYVAAYNSANSEFSTLKESYNSSIEEAEKLKETLALLRQENESRYHNEKVLSTTKETENELQPKLASCQVESEQLKEEIHNIRLKNGKLIFKSKNLQKELELIRSQGDSFANCSKSDEDSNTPLKDEINNLKTVLESLQNEKTETLEKIAGLEDRIDNLTQEREILLNIKSDHETLKKDYEKVAFSNEFIFSTDERKVDNQAGINENTNEEDKLLIVRLENDLKYKNEVVEGLEAELNRLKAIEDSERLELYKSIQENRQLSHQMNYWKQQLLEPAAHQQFGGRGEAESELQYARRTAAAFQVRVEELTTELTKLQEERDTLQLRLSNIMRQYERQRESSSRASTACSTPIPWVDPSIIEVKELRAKIEELGKLNYALDIELQKERENREVMQARLHSHSSSATSTPAHLPHRPLTSELPHSRGQVQHL